VINSIIKENKMEWLHLFEDIKGTDYSLVTRFKVSAFPTQILIDPKGQIILRLERAGEDELIAKAIESNIKE
jgi:thioredoxin-related protein